jgi:hypothetical protein
LTVGITLGDLLTRAVEVDQRTVEGVSTDGLRALQARPVLEVDRWTALRAEARRLGIPTARLVGLIIEREAHRLGWR